MLFLCCVWMQDSVRCRISWSPKWARWQDSNKSQWIIMTWSHTRLCKTIKVSVVPELKNQLYVCARLQSVPSVPCGAVAHPDQGPLKFTGYCNVWSTERKWYDFLFVFTHAQTKKKNPIHWEVKEVHKQPYLSYYCCYNRSARKAPTTPPSCGSQLMEPVPPWSQTLSSISSQNNRIKVLYGMCGSEISSYCIILYF